jgi:hypothetical protein
LGERLVSQRVSITRRSKRRFRNLQRNHCRFGSHRCGPRGSRIQRCHFANARSFSSSANESVIDKHIGFAGDQKENVVIYSILHNDIRARFVFVELSSVRKRPRERQVIPNDALLLKRLEQQCSACRAVESFTHGVFFLVDVSG